ncbi:MAG: EAL domain-containing protein [Rhizobiaceae bacterium]
MSGAAAGMPDGAGHAIVTDEIGLASAVIGDVHLRTGYRPLFARSGDDLHPVAVEGLVTRWRNGRALDPGGLDWGADAVRRANRLGQILSIRNMANIGTDAPLGLLMRWDGAVEAGQDAGLLLAEAEGAMLDPRLMIVLAETGTDAMHDPMRRWRDAGASIAVSDLGGMEAVVAHGLADLIRMDASWLSDQMVDSGAWRLLRVAVDRLREAGIGLLVDRVASPGDLQAALAISADLMQGPHLAAPFRVGTVFDDAPRPVAAAGTVVRLFG